jgi:hypothetical protein
MTRENTKRASVAAVHLADCWHFINNAESSKTMCEPEGRTSMDLISALFAR